ncbi:hypothetical protein OsJ_05926 [Oryza sativa Japonica Group]|uniref:DUF7050 domain-containing protein n=1 Tax=Oryza sativa subsp. japonica TaxID=39947 RepID=B9F4B8_ORYSJ|nr:hypothetical protein OsJ_05926 [Oryza sativa Japonica Group]
MDTIFVLGQESRQRILHRAAARLPGCAYVCAWAPLPLVAAAGLHHQRPSSGGAAGAARLLYCVDGWLSGGEDGGGCVRALFDAYRGSVCGAVTGCVPGWAYVGGGGGVFMELSELELVASASLPVQQSFYQEAGIKMAAFMGCESGEIEVGFSTAPAENYGGGGGGRSLSGERGAGLFRGLLPAVAARGAPPGCRPTRPSSSSSSLVGSPADGAASTSVLRTMTPMMASSSATPSPRELAAQVATTTTTTTTPSSSSRLHPRPPAPHHVHVSPFSRHGGVGGSGVLHFPSAEADDAAMAQAMLDVISSPSTSSSAAALHAPWSSVKHRAQIIRSPRRGRRRRRRSGVQRRAGAARGGVAAAAGRAGAADDQDGLLHPEEDAHGQAGEFDEASLKEAIAKAVESLVAPPPPP